MNKKLRKVINEALYKKKKKEVKIVIRCNCGAHKFLSLWKDAEWITDYWELAYSQHWLPLWIRIRYAFKLVFTPYELEGWEDFLISDKEMIKMAKKVLKYHNKKK